MAIAEPKRIPDTRYRGKLERRLNRIFKRHDLAPPITNKLGIYIALFWLLGAVLCFSVIIPKGLRKQDRVKLAVIHSWTGFITKPTTAKATKDPIALGTLFVVALPIIFQALNAMSKSKYARFLIDANRLADQQGRKHPSDLVSKPLEDGIPLGEYHGKRWGIKRGADAGHVLVAAPTRAGKGLHLTGTLETWQGAAVVVDPKREQYIRTSGLRSELGHIYCLPQHGIDVLDYFNIDDPLDFLELFTILMQTWRDREPIFSQKAYAIFEAARTQSHATGEHALKIVARWSNTAVADVVAEAQEYAPNEIAKFTDGDNLNLNRFTLSAWGTFTAKFATIAPLINTITTGDVPKAWASEGATIYICYPLDQLEAAGGLLSLIVSGLIKGQMKAIKKHYTLFAIDEAKAAALHKLDTKLATVGGYGITLLIYVQQLSQLREVYGKDASDSIIGNFHHQIFFPTRDNDSARYVSDKFGSEIKVTKSIADKSSLATQIGTALDPSMIDSLPPSSTIIFSDATATMMQRVNPFTNRKEPLPDAVELLVYSTNGMQKYDKDGRLIASIQKKKNVLADRQAQEAEREATPDLVPAIDLALEPAHQVTEPATTEEPPPLQANERSEAETTKPVQTRGSKRKEEQKAIDQDDEPTYF